jgi:hypothetical protein
VEFRGKRDAKSKKRRANDKVRYLTVLSLARLLANDTSRIGIEQTVPASARLNTNTTLLL